MFNKLRTLIQEYRVALLYRRYRSMAQRKADALNCKVYCVKVAGQPRLITRNDLKHLRSTRQVPNNFTSLDLQRIALFFVTPSNH